MIEKSKAGGLPIKAAAPNPGNNKPNQDTQTAVGEHVCTVKGETMGRIIRLGVLCLGHASCGTSSTAVPTRTIYRIDACIFRRL